MNPDAGEPGRVVARGVRSVLDSEAKRNELRVAKVRLIGFSVVVGIDCAMGALGLRPVENIAQSVVCSLWSGAVFLALRRAEFRWWYRYLIPALDAVMLWAILGHRLSHLGEASIGLAATTAILCALFSATGALRFERRSAIWTTVLAAITLVVLLRPYARPVELVYSLVTLAAVGSLTMSLTDLVRRSMEGSASQSVLRRFLPAELVDGAFADPLAGFGAPRSVDATVLVSDLRGFTRIAENMPPDELFRFLSHLHGQLAGVVHRHGGVVDKFLGDGMLAVFGVGAVNSEHSAAAVAAALELRRVLVRVNDEQLLAGPLRMGIGLHTGVLVAGCLGTGERLEWTVIGDTVNTASRLEALTKELGVDLVLSEAVVVAAGVRDARSLGRVPIRGREQEVEVFTVPTQAHSPTLLPASWNAVPARARSQE